MSIAFLKWLDHHEGAGSWFSGFGALTAAAAAVFIARWQQWQRNEERRQTLMKRSQVVSLSIIVGIDEALQLIERRSEVINTMYSVVDGKLGGASPFAAAKNLWSQMDLQIPNSLLRQTSDIESFDVSTGASILRSLAYLESLRNVVRSVPDGAMKREAIDDASQCMEHAKENLLIAKLHLEAISSGILTRRINPSSPPENCGS